ncbi:MAG: hypothetical protein JWR68_279 [Polaromonas sp.]|nr:hypothetical protein [Polaromonas sp.]
MGGGRPLALPGMLSPAFARLAGTTIFVKGLEMFFFFSNRLGWLGSILLSLALTLLLLFVFDVL